MRLFVTYQIAVRSIVQVIIMKRECYCAFHSNYEPGTQVRRD